MPDLECKRALSDEEQSAFRALSEPGNVFKISRKLRAENTLLQTLSKGLNWLFHHPLAVLAIMVRQKKKKKERND